MGAKRMRPFSASLQGLYCLRFFKPPQPETIRTQFNATEQAMNTKPAEGVLAPTLLVVDDDIGIRSLLSQNLSAAGSRVLTAANAAEMNRVLLNEHIDVIILDIMMPGEDGLSACRRLAKNRGPAVILLSALGDEADRISGLDTGADHYLPKPCSAREILAHVRAIVRQRERLSGPARELFFMGYRVDLNSHQLFDGKDVPIDLSVGEFAVLKAFLERPRRVLSRNDLLLAARGQDSESFDRAIDVQVSRLRRKLGDNSLIHTVRQEGYMFMAKVTSRPPA